MTGRGRRLPASRTKRCSTAARGRLVATGIVRTFGGVTAAISRDWPALGFATALFLDVAHRLVYFCWATIAEAVVPCLVLLELLVLVDVVGEGEHVERGVAYLVCVNGDGCVDVVVDGIWRALLHRKGKCGEQ